MRKRIEIPIKKNFGSGTFESETRVILNLIERERENKIDASSENKMNGFSTGEEDSRGPADQVCCLIDENERCRNAAGNASYSKRVQKTVTSRRLKLSIDPQVRKKKYGVSHEVYKCTTRFVLQNDKNAN